jgi:hypothetical protein
MVIFIVGIASLFLTIASLLEVFRNEKAVDYWWSWVISIFFIIFLIGYSRARYGK